VLDSFKNLRDGVNDGRAAAFASLLIFLESYRDSLLTKRGLQQMWEHFTTKVPQKFAARISCLVLTPPCSRRSPT
jgi:hypothetical protein